MIATSTREVRPGGGGPAPRWSPRRLGHHRYLGWAGAVVLAGVAAGVAVGADTAEPGITDGGGLTVLVVVLLVAPVLIWMTGLELITAWRRRVHDDVRVYGTGQAVRGVVPPVAPGPRPWPRPAEEVLLHVEVDRVPDAARVVERAGRSGRHRFVEVGHDELRLRSGRGTLTATGRDGRVRHRATRRALPGRYRARWEIELDGRRLDVEVRGLQPVPRRTLSEPDGTAWLLHTGIPTLLDRLRAGRTTRPHPYGRLPGDLPPDAVAFCLWLLCELEEHQDRVRSYGRTVSPDAPDPVVDAWTGHTPAATHEAGETHDRHDEEARP